MGSSCFGLLWDGREGSECRAGKGCSKINECLAKFSTETLAGFQRGLGPKKSTPEKLSELTGADPSVVLLAMNWQKNTGFSPFVIAKEPVRQIDEEISVPEELGPELDEGEGIDEEMFEDVSEDMTLSEAEMRAAQQVTLPKKDASKTVSKGKGEVASGNTQFCEKCKGTGKRGRGVCKACSGTGEKEIIPQAEIPIAMDQGTQVKPISRTLEARNEIETPMEGGDSRGSSADGVLRVQGEEVPDTVFYSSSDSGDDGLPETNRSTGKAPRRQKAGGNAKTDVVERGPVLSSSPIDSGAQRPGEKRQVIVDTFNKRIVGVNWPDYPSLMETPEEKIVQIIAWDTARNGFVKWVPKLSGDPNELLYKSLCQG